MEVAVFFMAVAVLIAFRSSKKHRVKTRFDYERERMKEREYQRQIGKFDKKK